MLDPKDKKSMKGKVLKVTKISADGREGGDISKVAACKNEGAARSRPWNYKGHHVPLEEKVGWSEIKSFDEIFV